MPSPKRNELAINADLNFWIPEVQHEKDAVEYYRTAKPKVGWGKLGTREGLRRLMLEHKKAQIEAQKRVDALLAEYKAARGL